MTLSRIKETFLRLPKHIKLIGLGSFILIISTFLPWYSDLDSYKIGDEFLGLTGPAYAAGIVILLLAGASFWVFSYHLLEKKVPKLPVREAIFNFFVGLESLFVLFIVNSIFFHPKFGVNITLKESRFGMTVAIVGAIMVISGAYFQNKIEIEEQDSEGKLEPLIKLEPTQERSGQIQPVKPQPTAYQRFHSSVAQKQAQESRHLFQHARPETKGFLFGEAAAGTPKHEQGEQQSGGTEN